MKSNGIRVSYGAPVRLSRWIADDTFDIRSAALIFIWTRRAANAASLVLVFAGSDALADLELPLPDIRFGRGRDAVSDAFVNHSSPPIQGWGGTIFRVHIQSRVTTGATRCGCSDRRRDRADSLCSADAA